MSESEQEQTTSPRFSKALFGRILAVGFFVVLGTFAVIQSMRGTAVNAVNATVSLQSDDSAEQENLSGSSPEGTTAGIGTGPDSITSINPAQFDKKKTETQKSNGFQPKTFQPPKPSSSLANSNTNSFGPNKSGPPPAKSFNASNSFGPPVNAKSTTNAPVVMPQSPIKQPERYAQANSGVPIIGNQSGFGSLDKRPKAPANTLGANAANKLDEAAKKTFGAAANLKSNVTDATNDLLRKAGQKSEAAVDATKNRFGGGFGPTQKTPKPFGGLPAKSENSPANQSVIPTPKPTVNSITGFSADQNKPKVFEPPKIQTGFADRPTNVPNAAEQFGAAKPVQNPGFGSEKTGPNVRPINSRLTTNAAAQFPKQASPFADPKKTANPAAQFPSLQTTNPPSNRGSSVPVQPISSGLSTIRKSNNRFGTEAPARATSQTRVESQLGNIRPATNNPLGNGGSRLATRQNMLTKDVPGDRQLDGVQAPALTVEKLSPREIQVNQTANFEIVVRNVGRATAENVIVFDEVPSGTEFIGAIPDGTRSAGSIEWNIGQLRPGQEKRIKLQLKPVQPGEIGSVAHVTFATQASMRTLVTKPVLEIVHQTNPTHLIGDDVVLDVVVSNKGDGPANNVMIQQDVPRQFDFPDGLPGSSRGIEYEIGTLLPGKSRRIKLALKAADIGKFQNIMYASADGGLSAQHRLPIEVVAPKLVAGTDGPTRRFLKRNVTHEFSVANKGTANAKNVELIARLPRGLRFVQANNQGRYDSNTHAVYWSLAELARDIEAKVELETLPVDVGSQPIKFESFADLNIRSNIEQPLSVEHLVDVFFDIDDLVDPIEIGSDTSYRVRVVNQGTKAASNVRLQVDFPPGLQPTSVDGSLRHNIRGQQIVFEPINSMSPQDEIIIVIHGKGQTAGDHRVVVNLQTDGRSTPVSKQETTRVYSDR